MFVALLKLDGEEALGAGGVTGAAGSVGAGSVVDGSSVAQTPCSGATAGEARLSSRIPGRLEGGVSRPPSSSERSAAATPESVMYSVG